MKAILHGAVILSALAAFGRLTEDEDLISVTRRRRGR